jgi:hypothetical protein
MVALLHAPVILLDPVVEVGITAMDHVLPKVSRIARG